MRSVTTTSRRILCVNCNICVTSINTLRRHLVLQLDPRVVTLITNWISPIIITEDDYICQACFDISMQEVNAQLPSSDQYDRCAGPTRRGHTQVCLLCGRSLVNRQSHLILTDNLSEHTQRVIQVIGNRVAPRQISPLDRTCHPCWISASRNVFRNEEDDEQRNVEIEMSTVNPNDSEEIPEPESQLQPELIAELPPDAEETHQIIPRPSESSDSRAAETNNIVLPTYRRAANTASHCIFYGCDRISGLHTISDALRVTVLINCNFYIPQLARVCNEHLLQNSWDTLFEAPNNISSFTAPQIEHLLSFIHQIAKSAAVKPS